MSSGDSEAGKPYLTPTEAAALLMVAPVTLRAWAAKGLLRAQTTAGGHRRFLRRDLERFARDRGLRLSDHLPDTSELRVLVVDDDRGSADRVVELLGACGVRAIACYDGFAAGRRLESFVPDVVVLEPSMRGIDGAEVCRALKADERTRHIRVIALLRVPDEARRTALLQFGAEACLPKPVERDGLLAAIHPPLRKARAPRGI